VNIAMSTVIAIGTAGSSGGTYRMSKVPVRATQGHDGRNLLEAPRRILIVSRDQPRQNAVNRLCGDIARCESKPGWLR
jgi:hypothetical protein